MGDIADMMLDGTLCEGCGVYIGDGMDAAGYPRRCSHCRREERENTQTKFAAPSNPAKVACQKCGRHVKAAGIRDHMRDKHGEALS
jgi:hypothetical protein